MCDRQAPTIQGMVLSTSPTVPGAALGHFLNLPHVGMHVPSAQGYDHFRTQQSGKDTRKSMRSYTGVACAALRSQTMTKWRFIKKLGCPPKSTLAGGGVLW